MNRPSPLESTLKKSSNWWPWDVQQSLERHVLQRHLMSPREWISQYYIRYRNWLYQCLQRRLGEQHDLLHVASFLVLYRLCAALPVYLDARHNVLQLLMHNVLLRGWLSANRGESPTSMVEAHPSIPLSAVQFLLHLAVVCPESVQPKISPVAFQAFLDLVPIPDLENFAAANFRGKAAFSVKPTVVSLKRAVSGVLPALPRPGYDLMLLRVTDPQLNHLEGRHLQFR